MLFANSQEKKQRTQNRKLYFYSYYARYTATCTDIEDYSIWPKNESFTNYTDFCCTNFFTRKTIDFLFFPILLHFSFFAFFALFEVLFFLFFFHQIFSACPTGTRFSFVLGCNFAKFRLVINSDSITIIWIRQIFHHFARQVAIISQLVG